MNFSGSVMKRVTAPPLGPAGNPVHSVPVASSAWSNDASQSNKQTHLKNLKKEHATIRRLKRIQKGPTDQTARCIHRLTSSNLIDVAKPKGRSTISRGMAPLCHVVSN